VTPTEKDRTAALAFRIDEATDCLSPGCAKCIDALARLIRTAREQGRAEGREQAAKTCEALRLVVLWAQGGVGTPTPEAMIDAATAALGVEWVNGCAMFPRALSTTPSED
jgi:hypothetical protein